MLFLFLFQTAFSVLHAGHELKEQLWNKIDLQS